MIGIFDSGSGGLIVVRALRKLAPRVDILYLADTANLPYGTKSHEEIKRLTLRIIAAMRAKGATTIVSACNSVSASVIRPMIELLGVRQSDVVEMVGPAVDELLRRHLVNAALIATPATIRSGMYASVAGRQGIHLYSVASPTLAGLIESDAPTLKIASAIREVLLQIPPSYSSVLLGCTHYPLALDAFIFAAHELGRSMEFIDPAEAVAESVIRLHGAQGNGSLCLACTGPTETVTRHARNILSSMDAAQIINSEVIRDFG